MNTLYFNATIQYQRDTFRKVACFDSSKHSTLMEATILKLTDVQIVPSNFDSSKSEVLVNHKTKIEVCRQLSFAYQKSTNDDGMGDKKKTVKEVENTPEYNKAKLIFL